MEIIEIIESVPVQVLSMCILIVNICQLIVMRRKKGE